MTEPELPQLQDTLLGREELEALVRDVGACTELLAIQAQGQGGRRGPALSLSLAEIPLALNEGEARRVQLRYRHEGQEWWDTLLRTPEGVRLVRIAHAL